MDNVPKIVKPKMQKKQINVLLDKRIKNYNRYISLMANPNRAENIQNGLRIKRKPNPIEKVNESALLIGLSAAAVGGAVIGAKLNSMWRNHKDKFVTCKKLPDEINKNNCYLKVLKYYIITLKDASNKECEDVPDPAQCKLDIMKKIDQVYKKMNNLQSRNNRLERIKNKKALSVKDITLNDD